jgi:hypothetical protein
MATPLTTFIKNQISSLAKSISPLFSRETMENNSSVDEKLQAGASFMVSNLQTSASVKIFNLNAKLMIKSSIENKEDSLPLPHHLCVIIGDTVDNVALTLIKSIFTSEESYKTFAELRSIAFLAKSGDVAKNGFLKNAVREEILGVYFGVHADQWNIVDKKDMSFNYGGDGVKDLRKIVIFQRRGQCKQFATKPIAHTPEAFQHLEFVYDQSQSNTELVVGGAHPTPIQIIQYWSEYVDLRIGETVWDIGVGSLAFAFCASFLTMNQVYGNDVG